MRALPRLQGDRLSTHQHTTNERLPVRPMKTFETIAAIVLALAFFGLVIKLMLSI